MMDLESQHWYEQPAIVARGSRITSRDVVTVMQAQERRWARFWRIAWQIQRTFRRLPNNAGVGTGAAAVSIPAPSRGACTATPSERMIPALLMFMAAVMTVIAILGFIGKI